MWLFINTLQEATSFHILAASLSLAVKVNSVLKVITVAQEN